MGTRYHYDKYGRYKGKTTDNRDDGGWLGFIIIIVMLVLISRGC